ncbi:MAG: polysaccharide pyruvyl transferase CsaB [Cyanobacteria bacterium P01_C01_bin.89]
MGATPQATKQALLCGYYGMGNGGDEALLATLLQMLPDSVKPLVLSGDPDQTRRRYGVTAIPRKSGLDILNGLSRSDAFIWGGGSLMQDATSAANPIYYGGLMGLAQGMGLKTVAWGQGIGPLGRSLSRWLTRRTFRRCSAISVRDGKSGKWLSRQGMDQFILAPDPVWALKASPVTETASLPSPRIAVVLRQHSTLTSQRLAAIAQGLNRLQLATQASILLVPFQPVVDRPIADRIARSLSGSYRIVQIENPARLKGLFQQVNWTLAMRLHGVIMAAAEGSRCFALSYDPKVLVLAEELGLPVWDLTGDRSDLAMPEDGEALGRLWLEDFLGNQGLSSAKIQSYCDRSQMHQEVLHQVLT